ncbi:hypothetical protein Scep_023525 [Stephania cephalantha]|uniref:Uncharacterized protein n=1 Tax=Stephania cephalantha TaxID=152367 RepID=A0AAP0HXK8_9MAGN
MWSCACAGSPILAKPHSKTPRNDVAMMEPWRGRSGWARVRFRVCVPKASMVDSYESSSNFVKRMEQAWLISQQPRPVACSSCESNGHVECKWCGGTGFFILGDNMLCQVPSRNTSCVICAGKGSTCCSDCKGTGFRAKWLGEPPIPKS